MVGLEVEVVRATLVIGIVIGALVYHFTRISSGGVVTAPFIALLVMTGRWADILGWGLIALAGIGIIRVLAMRWPLPRQWLFYFGIFATTAIHVAGQQLSVSPEFIDPQLGLFLASGVYVCSGLTAYDAARQGVVRTFVAAAAVTGLTVAVMLPLRYITNTFGGEQQIVTESPLRNPVLALICVGTAVAMRIGPRWGTAGIIGSLYLLNIANVQSMLVVVGFAVLGSLIYRGIADSLGLSKKERLYSLLAVGCIASWFGLFWAEYLGVPGAAQVAEYPVEPLIVIGLIIGETVRYGFVRTAAGSTVVFGVTAIAADLLIRRPESTAVVVIAAMAFVVAVIGVSLIRIRREWKIALEGGNRWGVQAGNLSDVAVPPTRLRPASESP